MKVKLIMVLFLALLTVIVGSGCVYVDMYVVEQPVVRHHVIT